MPYAHLNPGLSPWFQLPESIRDIWKIDPAYIKSVEKVVKKGSSVQQWRVLVNAPSAQYRYTWTFVRGRQQWAVRKTEIR